MPRLTIPVMRFDVSGTYSNQHAGVNRHIIHALLGLLFDHFQHYINIEIFHTRARD